MTRVSPSTALSVPLIRTRRRVANSTTTSPACCPAGSPCSGSPSGRRAWIESVVGGAGLRKASGQGGQRSSFGQAGVDRERGRGDGIEKASRAGQQRRPQSPAGVPGGDDRE